MKKHDESLAMKTKVLFLIQLWSEIRLRFLGFAIIVRIKDVRIEVRRGQHKFEKTLKTRTRTTKSLSHWNFKLFFTVIALSNSFSNFLLFEQINSDLWQMTKMVNGAYGKWQMVNGTYGKWQMVKYRVN